MISFPIQIKVFLTIVCILHRNVQRLNVIKIELKLAELVKTLKEISLPRHPYISSKIANSSLENYNTYLFNQMNYV